MPSLLLRNGNLVTQGSGLALYDQAALEECCCEAAHCEDNFDCLTVGSVLNAVIAGLEDCLFAGGGSESFNSLLNGTYQLEYVNTTPAGTANFKVDLIDNACSFEGPLVGKDYDFDDNEITRYHAIAILASVSCAPISGDVFISSVAFELEVYDVIDGVPDAESCSPATDSASGFDHTIQTALFTDCSSGEMISALAGLCGDANATITGSVG